MTKLYAWLYFFKVKEATDKILLNSAELNFNKVQFESASCEFYSLCFLRKMKFESKQINPIFYPTNFHIHHTISLIRKFTLSLFPYSVSMNFNSIEVKTESSKVDINEETEVATIHFSEPIQVGPGKLHIKYTGSLNDQLKGFYRSKYTNKAGEEAYAAVTQFEVILYIVFNSMFTIFGFNIKKI
jgi:hypothetical protein